MSRVLPEHQHWCLTEGHASCCGSQPEDCDCGAREVIAHIESLQARIAELEASITRLEASA